MLRLDEFEQLVARVALLRDRVTNIRAIEARDEDSRPLELQAGDDLGTRQLVRRSGEGDTRHFRKTFMQYRELNILGPEIVSPLRDAVRFVDGEERELGASEQLEKPRRQEPLGRDVE